MIISAINQQYNFPTVKFKGIRDKASYSHPFLSFEPLMSVPIETSRVYFSPVFTHGYREIANYNTPYTKACKMYELANGHKVIVFQKNGPMVMQTGVKTDDKVFEDYKHLIEHIIYNSNNKIGTQTFGDLQKDLALNRDAGCNSDVSLFTLKYSFDNPKDIEKVINAQSKLLFNADIERYFEKEKNIIKTELWENGHSEDMIKNLSINEAKEYYHKTYKNQNMVTAVSSPLPPDEIIRMFSKHFQNSDNTGFVSSNINRINVNEKDAFENFLKNVSRKKGNATLQAKAQSALTALTWTPGLINFSVEDIFKNGKPYILNYHTKLNQINNTLKQPSFKMNSSYVDTAGITEFIYPNNLTLTLDSGACSNAASKYHYLLKTDGFPAKPGTNEIVGCILSSALEQKAERQDYSLETTVYTGNNYIKIDSVCLPQYTLKDIKDIKNTLLHVNLS